MQSKQGRQYDQKMKPFLVYQYLMKNSDEQHPIPAAGIIEYLTDDCGIAAERRSVYRDIHEMNRILYLIENECSADEAEEAIADDEEKAIVYDASKKGFYVRQRHYELDDIREIAECIYAARFIDEKQSKALIDVLCDLVSVYQAETIRHDAFLVDRVKTVNKAYANVLIINDAIKANKKIAFKYTKFDVSGKLIERRGGESYSDSPYKLLINDGNYYLLAFSDKTKSVRTYRVDRMRNVRVTDAVREGKEEFAEIDLSSYTKRVFSMFSGKSERITMVFDNRLLDTAIERFGKTDATYMTVDERHFSVSTIVDVSEQFFGWLCLFSDKARITAPQHIVDSFVQYIDKIKAAYNK